MANFIVELEPRLIGQLVHARSPGRNKPMTRYLVGVYLNEKLHREIIVKGDDPMRACAIAEIRAWTQNGCRPALSAYFASYVRRCFPTYEGRKD